MKNSEYKLSKRIPVFVWVLIAEVLLCVLSNLLFLNSNAGTGSDAYRVDISRAFNRIRNGDMPSPGEYEFITVIEPFDEERVYAGDYAPVKAADGSMYIISYTVNKNNKGIFILNAVWAAVFVLTIVVVIYIEIKILKPFRVVSELPIELAKGNLTVPVNEEKDRYFGKFLWGMDVLREHMEEEKEKNLALEREKKTLILTLSHDIKTPLSAIKLYNKALSRKLYDTEEKQLEAYAGIEKNTDELEAYVEDIRNAVREDFLKIEVKNEEWYMSEVIDDLSSLYKEKTAQLHTELKIESYDDCLLKGDRDRALEVLQNLMENAIKYGDGKRIAVSFADEENCRLITVSNTGGGFDKKELPNLFDSFYRGSNVGKQKGSGLGLYIAKNLMRAMDGDIYAEAYDNTFSVTAVFRRE
ncbi:MAG: HAMP domain-containing histidine kinase [Lachnospiraceae bacterium]|nr:HAMP domain-containing histidine kinase [Lachnospiraceae bacterium]